MDPLSDLLTLTEPFTTNLANTEERLFFALIANIAAVIYLVKKENMGWLKEISDEFDRN
jgi:hypothetical protein